MVLHLKSCPRCGGDIYQGYDQDSGIPMTKDGMSCMACGFSPDKRKDYYSPMLAKLAKGAFDSEKHIFEPKYDGIRAVAYIKNGKVRFMNRAGNDVTDRFPEIDLQTNCDCVIDGEMVCFDANGVPDFQLMQTRMNRKDDILDHSKLTPAVYCAFDIIAMGKLDITTCALIRRKQILQETLILTPSVQVAPYTEYAGVKLFKQLDKLGWEGIMAKDRLSPYTPGARTILWQKIKAIKEGIFTVVGMTFGWGKRESSFGALIVAGDANGYYFHMGEVGTGFTDDDLVRLTRMLSGIISKEPTLDEAPRGLIVKHWLEPKMQIRVAYQEITNDNKLRHPSFQGVVKWS